MSDGVSVEVPIQKEISPVVVSKETEDRRLKPANRLFFHTTPLAHVDSLIADGLISRINIDTLGRDLFYSLTFDNEFNNPAMRRMRTGYTVNNFVLTLWKRSEDIKQKVSDESLATGGEKPIKGQYAPVRKLESDEQIPKEYELSYFGGRIKVDKEDLRKVSPENFLASIPITDTVKLALARAKFDLLLNFRSADQVEEFISRLLTRQCPGVKLGSEYSIEALAHDLTANLEQEVVLKQTGMAASYVLDYLKIHPSLSGSELQEIQHELMELKTKLSLVNEPLSKRYLQILEERIKAGLRLKGQEQVYEGLEVRISRDNIPYSLKGVNTHDIWKGNEGIKLALETIKLFDIPYRL